MSFVIFTTRIQKGFHHLPARWERAVCDQIKSTAVCNILLLASVKLVWHDKFSDYSWGHGEIPGDEGWAPSCWEAATSMACAFYKWPLQFPTLPSLPPPPWHPICMTVVIACFHYVCVFLLSSLINCWSIKNWTMRELEGALCDSITDIIGSDWELQEKLGRLWDADRQVCIQWPRGNSMQLKAYVLHITYLSFTFLSYSAILEV